MTKEKALYQVKLIFDAMDENDYKRIPRETIDYVEQNMEYDENIKIDPSIPLEDQNIDDYACDFLEKMINDIERKEKHDKENNAFNVSAEEGYSEDSLKELVKKLREENDKIPKIKEMVIEYKDELARKNKEIEELKKRNEELYTEIEKVPKFVRKIFFVKLEKKLLN